MSDDIGTETHDAILAAARRLCERAGVATTEATVHAVASRLASTMFAQTLEPYAQRHGASELYRRMVGFELNQVIRDDAQGRASREAIDSAVLEHIDGLRVSLAISGARADMGTEDPRYDERFKAVSTDLNERLALALHNAEHDSTLGWVEGIPDDHGAADTAPAAAAAAGGCLLGFPATIAAATLCLNVTPRSRRGGALPRATERAAQRWM